MTNILDKKKTGYSLPCSAPQREYVPLELSGADVVVSG
ncbi:hypothetical protein PTE30175_02646 [Pandoraea terrae]|uniref:Uncharacterized protein n=1 Tax=Pandoraea terrae TaxID=1537710 RepID=A0A5E4VLD6_9BURK|nr:hypothetical protein PTE30175_02646 [Pandoraea terrae]